MTLKRERNKENNRRGEAENLTKGDEQQSKEKPYMQEYNNGWL